MWVIFAFGSAVFAGLTAILAKLGIRNVDSTLAAAIRTVVVLLCASLMVFIVGSQNTISDISSKTFIFLVLSGIATGGSWLCFYHALQNGPASVVVPIDKLSIAFTIAFSFLLLKEKLSARSFTGLAIIIAGTLILLV